MAHQLVVFVENKPGRLAHVTEALAAADVNIRAVTIASAGHFGLVKLIVDKPEEAYRVLKGKRFSVNLQEVLAVALEDRPGGLHNVLSLLAERGLNIKDACGFIVEPARRAILVLEVEDFARARERVREAGIDLYEEELSRL
ncbi:MAG: ACT domain-containing protein [bacterium]